MVGSTAMTQSLPPVFKDVVLTIVPEASQLNEQGWGQLGALVKNMLAQRPPALVRQLRLLLNLIELLPVLRYGRPFSALDSARRTKVLAYLQDHPVELVRVGFWGLRTLALLGYYGRAEASEAIGYAASAQGWEALR